MLESVHHINLLVRDLTQACARLSGALGVADLDAAIATLAERGTGFTAAAPRRGLADWHVIDTALGAEFGVDLQLCAERPT